MLSPADDVHLPASLFALCAMSAMAFVLAPAFWLRRAAAEHETGTLEHTVWRFQIYAILTAVFGFMIYNIYGALRSGPADGVSFWPEPLVLCMAALISGVQSYRYGKSVFHGLRQETGHIALLALACLAGWTATALAGWTATALAGWSISALMNGAEAASLFLAGTLWLAPSVYLYSRLPEREKRPEALKRVKLHHVLWPVMMAYLVLFAPLQAQYLLNTEQWQKARSVKVLPLKDA